MTAAYMLLWIAAAQTLDSTTLVSLLLPLETLTIAMYAFGERVAPHD